MAFKLTYTDGQEDSYDDETAWAVEDAVLKMGHEEGKWTVLVSPSHWATIEVTQGRKRDGDEGGGKEKDKDKEKDKNEKDKGDSDKDEDDKDDKDDKDKDDKDDDE